MFSVITVLLSPSLRFSSHVQHKNWRVTITFKDVLQTVRDSEVNHQYTYLQTFVAAGVVATP